MRELTIEQTNQVSAGVAPLILLADLAIGMTIGSTGMKLWKKL
ncbi:MAG: hypothetical protein AAGB12_16035 [Pseudomonadota bacterium]